jgi:ABC-type polysaccharide/polyol phosphate transport system ATPase subunit
LTPIPAVSVEHVGKRFEILHRRAAGLKEMALGRLRRARVDHEELWALRDVSFSVNRGEMVGLVGANGSGKSTLLQVIAGIYEPDTGSVAVNGRLRALLELGTGFNSELSGRENIFLNASLLGLKRADIRRRFDGIVEFAELERFIDMPLKTYSSGMQVRLAFATAAHLDPEILLLDEVLAVGDDAFQRKCLGRIREIREGGAAIVFVSHDLLTIEQLCDRVGHVDQGRLVGIGDPAGQIGEYRASLARLRAGQIGPRRWGTGAAHFGAVVLLDGRNQPSDCFRTGEPMTIRMEYEAPEEIPAPVFGLAVRTRDGTLVTGPNTKMCGYPIQAISGRGVLEYKVPALPLLPGSYDLSMSVYDETLLTAYDHWEHCSEFVVLETGTRERFGAVTFGGTWKLRQATRK